MMKWNVYRYDINKREIVVFNVFDHGSFVADVKKLLKKKLEKDLFTEELRRSAMYYFWSKCEYEVVVTSWPPHITEEELNRLSNEDSIYRHTPNLDVGIKIDIYDQLRLNWNAFVEYTYNIDKKELKK